jgi:hypothetical protein
MLPMVFYRRTVVSQQRSVENEGLVAAYGDLSNSVAEPASKFLRICLYSRIPNLVSRRTPVPLLCHCFSLPVLRLVANGQSVDRLFSYWAFGSRLLCALIGTTPWQSFNHSPGRSDDTREALPVRVRSYV